MFIHSPNSGHLVISSLSSNEHWRVSLCLDIHTHNFGFNFLGNYIGVKLLNHLVSVYLTYKLPNCFPKQLYYFEFPPAMYECFSCSIFWRTLDTVSQSFKFYPFWSGQTYLNSHPYSGIRHCHCCLITLIMPFFLSSCDALPTIFKMFPILPHSWSIPW